MSEAFRFSDPGEGLEEAEVLEIHVSEGDHVNDGDTVLTVETDKAATDIPAPFSGTVETVHPGTGDRVRVDDLLITYRPDDESGGGEEEKGASAAESRDEASREDASHDRDESASSGESDDETPETDGEAPQKDAEESAGAGSGRQDQGARKEDETRGPGRQTDRRQPVPAAPSTRRIAREKGVDLHEVEPSGPQGRVTAEDVEAAAKAEPGDASRKAASTGQESRQGSVELPDFSRWGETEREAMRSIRRATARRMSQSWQAIPHVYHQDVADITALERFRRDYEPSAETNGGKFTMTVLMLKAMVYALKQYPRFNASLDAENDELILKRYFHIGVAVATDQGLLVPVLRDVDRKNLIDLTAELKETIDKAKAGELGRDDMEGGCITLTNPGPMGGTSLSPLINPPEVAILGMGQARLEPVVHGDLDDYEVKPRLMLPLSLGFDHRANDGADAAGFVTTLIGALEDPHSLLLKI
ncbi:dihydrolipoamide acetyltransferase family protein [Modicisalibacter tunisiensis]|uniref:Dihydrolipoamide acetyltransferase component of pyruvate dehydrogenase complex n=1 Tax=Modicisalibacter tunisiensis TaxID=390637 RepID=A0ABS7X0P1_9GAMM|nr:dihydrolipoamide acetyltransferase family protein [Modicisalibacter tunisiensis]MBZ9538140.1 2-oxo acid dehydrogenase subunit E2 [Modicisalibacter tunisiensis]MBZ9568450.1 2-oxo acid dehydrogenase subunit E2 [Modicisalibacter tunisiensis]